MVEIKKIIQVLGVDSDLLLKFFIFFSRFEYSLKRSSFLMKESGKAEPNWGVYAMKCLRGHVKKVKNKKFQEAVAFLMKEPPKTQIVSGIDLGWEDTIQRQGEHQEDYVLRLVRTVRNNLFHGGKYPHQFEPFDNVTRNQRLLEAAITILSQCLELSEGVRAKFEEEA